MDKEVTEKLIKDIKKKKEFQLIDDSFVLKNLNTYLKKNQDMKKFLQGEFSERNSLYKEVVKRVREELRKVHGLFQVHTNVEKRRAYLEELLKKKEILEGSKKILETHASTKERVDFYPDLYKKLFKITGKPKRILDLGCGLNPFSIPFMDFKGKYYAYDISDEEIWMIRKYLDFLGALGEAEVLDMLHWAKIEEMGKVDVCLMFKVTDVLDKGKGHKASEEVMTRVPAKFLVVSFPTYTVTGKRMNYPRRGWIEMMCKRLKCEFKVIKESNEIFYVIKKSV